MIDELCGEDEALRARVRALQVSEDEAGDFLESPTMSEANALALAAASAAATAPPEKPGSHIGPYKLLQVIGEGGFGVVYMAEQEEPIRRRVALKVIKPGMDTKQVIARFEAERQALAMMDHPNIAKVFEAGTTPAGHPYFVMELVKGVTITDYCDEHRLGTRERLALFTDVCGAVQHAHEAGIIHRDIKPSNVMVTLHEGTPVPKVIDFGVAKATHQRLTDTTLFTEYNQFIGTPTYVSPEQATYEGLDVDSRADVYSLGVLLYELLTGTTPHDSQALKRAAYLEVIRILKEDEPPKPSTRIQTMGVSSEAHAKHRDASAVGLAKVLRGYLDWIVMKALEKERSRRYGSASEMADDISRYFDQLPIVARPPSAVYRAQKLLRRKRGPFAAAAVVVLAMFAQVGYIEWQRSHNQPGATLATAAGSASPAFAGTSELMLRRVWVANDLKIRGQVSRDGRYIPFADQATLDLSIRDLTTGQNRRLTQNRDPSQGVDRAQISDDNRWIAYGWTLRSDDASELRVIAFDGSGERTLRRWRGLRDIDVFGWSTDGEHVLAGISLQGGSFQIAWVSIEDGSLQLVKTLHRRPSLPHMHLSPDGRWIAYDFFRGQSGNEESIALLAADGSREITVVGQSGDPADADMVAWLPDGSGLLFRSDRDGDGEDDLWLLELDPDGTPSGEPTLVKESFEDTRGLGFTDSGTFFYEIEAVSLQDVYLARLDPTTGRVLETPTKANTMFEDDTRLPDWSPDGMRLAYFVQGDRLREPTIVIRDLASGDERFLPIDLRRGPGRDAMRWAPDGGSLLFRGGSREKGHGFFRIDAETGRSTPMVTFSDDVTMIRNPVWAPDGQAIFYQIGKRATGEIHVVRLDLATGEEKQLYGIIGLPTIETGMAISPDGGYLAVLYPSTMGRPTQLMVLPTTGGELREVYRAPEGEHLRTWVAWTPQGELIFGTHSHEVVGDPMTELWRIRLDGQERRWLGSLRNPYHISVHPDGTWIAARLSQEAEELWAIENLLAQLGAPAGR